MSLSLVSAPVLGFDLTRHPNGRELARLLVWAIAVDSVDLARAAAAGAGPCEDADPLAAARAEVLADDDGRLDREREAPGEGSSLTVLAASLVRSLVLRHTDVAMLLVSDVLAWTDGDPRAESLRRTVVDAATAWWTRPPGHAGAADLTRAFRDLVGAGDDLPLEADPPAVATHLAVVRALGPAERDRWRHRIRADRPGSMSWSRAMHEASWAVVATDRVRQAAVNQFLAVDAWFVAGFTAEDGAEGLWNALSGHIQALTVADVLADAPRATLTAAATLS